MDVLTEHFISFLNVSFLLKYNKLAKNNINEKKKGISNVVFKQNNTNYAHE